MQVIHVNIMILANIVDCQSVSIATCERSFSLKNEIKIEIWNHSNNKKILAIEWPYDDFDHILVATIELWRIQLSGGTCILTYKNILVAKVVWRMNMILWFHSLVCHIIVYFVIAYASVQKRLIQFSTHLNVMRWVYLTF